MSYMLAAPATLLKMGAGMCGVDITRAVTHEPRLKSEHEVGYILAQASWHNQPEQ
jgi:hypothetical protein